ncbi:hypothetical protein E4U31_004958 [Claviceps sp. LM219 group G6]|nr:hypothetical protein E4U31_004958 [Claviceps sp. LM219 group G6]
MDQLPQINLPPNHSRSLVSNTDPILSSSSDHWLFQSPALPLTPWRAEPLPLDSFLFTHGQTSQRPFMDSIPSQSTQIRQHGALPHRDSTFGVLQTSETSTVPTAAPVYWTFHSDPASDMTHYVPDTNSGVSMPSMPSSSLSGLAHANSGIRGSTLQTRSWRDWESPTSTPLSTAVHPFPSVGRPRTASEPFTASLPSTIPSYPPQATSFLRATQIPRSRMHRAPQSQSSFTLFESREPADIQSSAAERHRLALLRNRRTTSALHPGSGLTNTEAGVEGRRGTQAAENGESHASTSRTEFSARQTEEAIARQLQAIRGATSRKLVASKAALQSLETVEMCSLAENEKTCVICYNDYGAASPEGVVEAPTRLPLCKHIFGDLCIKKWLGDSDSCPYCRRRMQSEPKRLGVPARAFLNMMRVRGLPAPSGLSEEVMNRNSTRPITDVEFQELFLHAARTTTQRRPPPDDNTAQEQRRTRQRLNAAMPEGSLVPDNGDAQSRSTPDAPSWQVPASFRGFVRPGENSSAVQQTFPDSSAFLLQQGRQFGFATGERTAENGQAASARPTTRPADNAVPLVVNGSSLRGGSTPNPLLRSNRMTPLAAVHPSPGAGTYNASILSTMDGSTQRPADADLSALGSSRIRPW